MDLQYKNNLSKYGKLDGVKAIAVYIVIMGSAFFQGWLYTTNVSVFVLNSSHIWLALLLVLLFVGFLYGSKEEISSVGIHLDHIRNSMALGIAGGILLLALQTMLFMMQGANISFIRPIWMNWMIFCVSAFEEELLFRGYIQTRLSGMISRQWIASMINAVLFLSIHYPVRWVVSGTVSFEVLPAVYIVSLLALHVFCDIVYKRTNCLWGSIVLHIIYNAVGAMIVVQ